MLVALTALLVAGLVTTPIYLLQVEVAAMLLRLVPHPTGPEVEWLTSFALDRIIPVELPFDIGPAQHIERRHAPAWRALYLVVAAERLQIAGATGEGVLVAAQAREQGYFELHLQAEERRMRSAALVDQAAVLLSDRTHDELLGWRAVLDHRTTRECRWAHGRNFRADQIPNIGWPGAVHVRCRCSPGPAIPGAPLIPSA